MKITNKKIVVVISAFICGFIMTNRANAVALLDWNEDGAAGVDWPGWTWYEDASGYDHPGWKKNDGHELNWNWYPRVHLKNDTGNDDLASVDIAEKAPGTSDGASLKVYDTGVTTSYNPGWWFLYGDSFGTLNLADGYTDRMDFYLKVSPSITSNLTSDPNNSNIHVGTYNCWPGGGWGDGADCPTEASNQHYYHYLTINGGAWLHVQLDRHPTHQRNVGKPVDNPTFAYAGKHYFETMNAFYVQVTNSQSSLTTYWIDEIKLWNQEQSENDESITSPWIGYWPDTGKWEVGFNDLSFGDGNYGDFSKSKHEIRWSTSPITNANWDSANTVVPEYHRFGSSNSFRRPNSWKSVTWTRFDLPEGIEDVNDTVFFAIKDVSSLVDGDGHDAPSSFIRTIGYEIRPAVSDLIAPFLSDASNVGTTKDTTPSFSFTSNEAGTISYGGSCSSATTSATVGENTIILNALNIGTYSNCSLTVTDSANNVSTPVALTAFHITYPGDLDLNRNVNIFDYNLLLANFGQSFVGDADGDNDIDIFDYNILIGDFGSSF